MSCLSVIVIVRKLSIFAQIVCILALGTISATAAETPDPTAIGPYDVTSSEYRLPAAIDPQIDRTVTTELWARIYRPKYLYIRPYPVIIFLHGNHGTCGRVVAGIPGRFDHDVRYTKTGTCPRGFTVVRNHEGFAYVAERLASWGYFVVSINANRGINGGDGAIDDPFLNFRRARLVLRHLELLDQWNRNGGAPKSLGFDMRKTLDFSQIGLMGHSRGGEGVLAAYNLFKELGSPWPSRFGSQPVFRGIFTIAPVANQTSRPLYTDNMPWAALLPLCDGDVYTMDALQVYNKAIRNRYEIEPGMKAIFGVWGANHNFYNTEWQQSDSAACVGRGNKALFSVMNTGSSSQRETGMYAILAFFRSHMGRDANADFVNLFNPSFTAPKKLASLTRLERSFSESARRRDTVIIDDFSRPAGLSSRNILNSWRKVKIDNKKIVGHGSSLKANAIQWSRNRSVNPRAYFFQSNGWAKGKGRKLGALQNLEFRVSLACQESSPQIFTVMPDVTNSENAALICNRPFPVNADGSMDFSVSLVTAEGRISKSVSVSRYARLHNPVGGKSAFFSLFPPIEDFTVLAIHPLLQTVRMPLADFGLSAASQVRGVRFTFDKTERGSIYLANVRFSKSPDKDGATDQSVAPVAMKRAASDGTLSTSIEVHGEAGAITKPAARKGGIIASIQTARSKATVAGKRAPEAALVELNLSALHPVPVRDLLLMLRIGDRQFMLSRFANNGDTTKVTFSMTQEEYSALPNRSAVELINGPERLSFGTLNKN